MQRPARRRLAERSARTCASADGTSAPEAAAALHAAGVDALGVNCGSGPHRRHRRPRARWPGAPTTRRCSSCPTPACRGASDGQFVWAAAPAYFADEVPRFLAVGARLVGGCCGTTPEHVAAMRQALDREPRPPRRPGAEAARAAAGRARARRAGRLPAPRVRDGRRRPARRRSTPPPPTGLATALAAGRFVISVEIDPPRSVRIERTLAVGASSSATPARTS